MLRRILGFIGRPLGYYADYHRVSVPGGIVVVDVDASAPLLGWGVYTMHSFGDGGFYLTGQDSRKKRLYCLYTTALLARLKSDDFWVFGKRRRAAVVSLNGATPAKTLRFGDIFVSREEALRHLGEGFRLKGHSYWACHIFPPDGELKPLVTIFESDNGYYAVWEDGNYRRIPNVPEGLNELLDEEHEKLMSKEPSESV